MDFGLGLILSFTDNATAGINNAVNSFNTLTSVAENASSSLNSLSDTASLSALSVMSNQLGSSMTNTGNKILGFIQQQVNGIQSVGTEFQSLRITLNAMMKDEEKAETALTKLMNFAATTPFEITDLTGIFTTITANGLDAFQELTGATTGFNESLLGAIGDLMAFRPDVPAQQWGIAIRNAFSGEVRSLKNALDINVNDMLGHKWGSTGDIAQDFMDLADAIGVAGMMSNNFDNNMAVQMANMSDVFTKIKLAIADTGVFDKMTASVLNISSALARIDGPRLDALAKSLGEAIQSLLNPLVKLTDKLGKFIDKLVDFIGEHPHLTKVLVTLTAISGVALVVAGTFMKLIGSLAGFLIVIKEIGPAIFKVSQIFSSGFATMVSSILPLVATMGLLAVAWRTDFGGIRTMTVNFIENLVDSWRTAKEAVDGSVIGLRISLNNLRNKDDFWSNITIGFMKIYGTFKFLAEAWNSYELSEESFEKAQALGILPLITSILMLKWRFEQFAKGFKQGWKEVSDYVQGVIDKLTPKLKGTIFQDMIDKATEFFQLFTNGDGSDWENFGNKFAHFTAKALVFGVAIKGLTSILGKVLIAFRGVSTVTGFLANLFPRIAGLVRLVVTPFKSLFSVVSTLVSGGITGGTTVIAKLANAFALASGGAGTFAELLAVMFPEFEGIISAISSVGTAIASIGAGPILAVLSAVLLVIGGIVSFATTQKEKFTAMIDSIKDTFSSAVENVKSRFQVGINFIKSVLGPTIDNIKNAIGNLKEAFSKIGDGMKDSPIIQYLGLIGQYIMTKAVPAINFLITLVGSVLGNAFVVLSGIISSVISTIGNVFSGIVNVISGIVNVISGLISLDFSKVGKGLLQMVQGLLQAIGGLLSGIVTAFASIITAVFGIGRDIVMGLINGIKQYISGVVELFKSVIDWVKDIFGVHSPSTIFMEIGTFLVQGLLNGIKSIINTVILPFKSLLLKIKNLFNPMPQFFSNLWSKISTTTTKVWNTIKQTVTTASNNIKNTVSNAWNMIRNTISSIGSSIGSTVSSVFNGVVSTIGGAMNSAQNTVSSGLRRLSSLFANTKLSLPHIKVPHFNISGGVPPFGIGGKGSKPVISVDWYARGGVFDSPSIIGVGENGKEAVMPLENNLGWIDSLASMISNKMGSSSDATPQTVVVTPVATPNNVSSSNNITKSVTNNNTSNVTNNSDNGSVDNSVHFEAGSIVIQAKEFSNAEAEKFAKLIMEKIKRQKEINSMLKYQMV